MTKSLGTILAGQGRPGGRGTGTAPFNIYAASVALLWTTALRAATPPRTPRSTHEDRCGLIVRCAGDFLASLRR